MLFVHFPLVFIQRHPVKQARNLAASGGLCPSIQCTGTLHSLSSVACFWQFCYSFLGCCCKSALSTMPASRELTISRYSIPNECFVCFSPHPTHCNASAPFSWSSPLSHAWPLSQSVSSATLASHAGRRGPLLIPRMQSSLQRSRCMPLMPMAHSRLRTGTASGR